MSECLLIKKQLVLNKQTCEIRLYLLIWFSWML